MTLSGDYFIALPNDSCTELVSIQFVKRRSIQHAIKVEDLAPLHHQ